MKFGKHPHPETITYSLPADPAKTIATLATLPPRPGPFKVYLGCTGWSMKAWTGQTYPAGAKTKDYLKYYGEQFNTIELNTTHYRIPEAKTIDNWIAQTPRDFRFCPKVVQRVSHARDMGVGSGLLTAFCESIERLGERLGPCFAQLPPYFGADRYAQLETFLKNWPPGIRLAVEVRHESWFASPEATTTLLELLGAYKVGAVVTDVAGRRDVLHMGITTPFTMIRWVGNGLIDSDYHRADQWVNRIKQWMDQGLHEVYLFPHQPDNLLAPEMTDYFTKAIATSIPKAEVRGPALPYQTQVGQLGLF